MLKTLSALALVLVCTIPAYSQSLVPQQSFMITDTSAIMSDGLTLGFRIKNEKEKEVGNKGAFSRYSMEFYVTNNSNEAKIFLYNPGWAPGNDVSPNIARFDVLNATGARLTSKMVLLQMSPCDVLGQTIVKDKANNAKPMGDKQPVRIGYWLRPGEMIRTEAIVIVPLNQQPSVQATLYPNFNPEHVANARTLGSFYRR